MNLRWRTCGRTTSFLAGWLLTGLVLSILTFVLLYLRKVHSQNAELRSQCLNGALVLQSELYNNIFSSGMYNGLIHAFPNITTAEFETFGNFTNFILPYCVGISYFRYIPGDQRAAAEAELGTGFTESAPPRNSIIPTFTPRANASEYIISWRMSNRIFQTFFTGWDLLSDPSSGPLVNSARDSGNATVSSPFTTPLVGSNVLLSVLWPFYTQNPYMYRTVAARRANFKGIILAFFNIGKMFDMVAAKFTTPLERVAIYDTTNTTDLKHGGIQLYERMKLSASTSGRAFAVSLSQQLGPRSYRLECRKYVGYGPILAAALPWSCLFLLGFLLVALSVYLVTRRFQRDKEEVRRVEKLNTELDIARQTAESADKAKSSFLAMMSHELRTPMTGTLGMLDLLRLTPMTEEQCLYVTTMQSSAESLLACLNDILDFSKIEAGQLRLEEIDFDIADVVKQVTGLFSGKLQEKGLQMHIELPEPVDCKARGDPLRLQQILTNLLSNAIKFTEAGSITICWKRLPGPQAERIPSMSPSFGSRRLSGASYKGEVAVDIDRMGDREEDEDLPSGCMASVLRRRRPQVLSRGSSDASDHARSSPYGSEDLPHCIGRRSDSDTLWYEFSVSDTGLGILEDVQRRLFRSFVQADHSTTRMFGGTGLGLVICKKLVTAMGGQISVRSEVNEGSTFTCTVGLRAQQPDSSLVQEPDAGKSQHSDRLSELSNLLFPQPKPPSQESQAPHRRPELESVQEAHTDPSSQPIDPAAAPASRDTDRDNIDSHSRTESSLAIEKENASDPDHDSGTTEMIPNQASRSGDQPTSSSKPDAPISDSPIGEQSPSTLVGGGLRENQENGAVLPIETVSSSRAGQPVGVQEGFLGEASESKDIEPAAHILVAEDNLVNQMLIKKMLIRFGHRVDIVGNGALAVEAVKTSDYALCLMDLQMPVLDGISATEQIRRLDPPKCDLPIYVLSADVLAQNKLSKDLRIDGYLTKPIKWDILLTSIEEKLKSKGLPILRA